LRQNKNTQLILYIQKIGSIRRSQRAILLALRSQSDTS